MIKLILFTLLFSSQVFTKPPKPVKKPKKPKKPKIVKVVASNKLPNVFLVNSLKLDFNSGYDIEFPEHFFGISCSELCKKEDLTYILNFKWRF